VPPDGDPKKIGVRNFGSFEAIYAELVEPWLLWPPERPWGNIEAWSKELFGLRWEKVLDVIEPVDPDAAQRLRMIAAPEMPAWGEVGNGRSRGAVVTSTRGSNASSYLAARLKRDRPDLAAEIEAGRMKIRDAARQAKILKPPDPGRRLDKAWAATTPEQRAAFVDDHADELQRLLDLIPAGTEDTA
jgi:hypothetical protein